MRSLSSQLRAILSSQWFQAGLVVCVAILIGGAFFYWRSLKPEKTKNIEFILDASGSMELPLSSDLLTAILLGSESKMDAAKRVLTRRVQGLPSGVNAGLRIFRDCDDIELAVPIGAPDARARIEPIVAMVEATALTPIAESLLRAERENDFPQGPDQDNLIVLVSDGYETCGGDPCVAAGKLKESGINATTDVIGLGKDPLMDSQFQCIAQITGGTYTPVRDPQTLENVTRDITGCSCSWPIPFQGLLVAATIELLALWPMLRFVRQ
jgi:hypothetical protein